ncbi:renalase-like [Lingula anatina]|nr:renalase-like [Lingula anatina]XP_013409225.1 renalase-like [Lingula anatina]XP_013409226.1 renalase-like [Lingula anatina]|eukprot:XP_013409224.1 renalase-like [Lingula anatina]
MKRILLVGGGLTAASTASLLRQSLGQQAELVLWDKARGAGGRMSTSRSPNDGVCTADLGAQYITATPSYAESHKK